MLYAPVFYELYSSRWKTADYTHAYFILPVFLWLVWRKRGLIREHLQKSNTLVQQSRNQIPLKKGGKGVVKTYKTCPHENGEKKFLQSNTISNFVGLFMLVFGASMFIFGWRQDYIFFTSLSLLLVIYGLTICLYGLKTTKVLFFPILYLILLVPIPIGIIDSITLPMRYGVSVVTEIILKLLLYPITREGLLLSIGNNELFIGQPCSGFRSLITMFSAGLIYVFISKTGFPQKSMLVASIIPLALLGNLFRIIILCLITYHFGEAAGQGFFHNFSGIMMIVLITVGLIGLEYCLEKYTPNTSHLLSPPHGGGQGEEMSPSGGGAGGVNIPRPHSPPHGIGQGEEPFFPRPWWEGLGEGDELIRNKGYINKKVYVTNALLLFTIIFCFGFSGTKTLKTKYVSQDILSRLEIPYEIREWKGKDVVEDWNLDDNTYKLIEHSINREYKNKNDENIYFTVVDAGNFHNPKICANCSGFKTKDRENAEFHIISSAQAESSALKARAFYAYKEVGNNANNYDGYLITYWVCINKKHANWLEEKVKELWFAFFNNERINLMVRVDVPCKEGGIETALQLAGKFITDLSRTIPLETSEYLFGKL